MNKQVQVGLGVIVVDNKTNRVLMGERKGSHAAGAMSFPGGGLEFGESWEAGALRELAEECGPDFRVRLRRFNDYRLEYFVTNDIMPQFDKHYITIFVLAEWLGGEPINTEPEKCCGWRWIDWDELMKFDNLANWIPIDLLKIHRLAMNL